MTAAGDVLDFNPKKMREAAASDAINAIVDAGLVAKRAKQPKRDYLGASAIGGPCARQTQFEYAGAPRDPHKPWDGKILRIFDRGYSFEELAAAWLNDAGFKLSRWNPRTREPYGFEQMGGRFKGHVDGVLLGGPDAIQYPALWEHKALGNKSFNAIARNGLAREKPVYADQVAVYQAYLQLTENPAVFTVTNADTCEQQHLLVPYDAERAQAASDRAVKIINATDAGELLPRAFSKADHFECRFCAFAQRCWGMPG